MMFIGYKSNFELDTEMQKGNKNLPQNKTKVQVFF